ARRSQGEELGAVGDEVEPQRLEIDRDRRALGEPLDKPLGIPQALERLIESHHLEPTWSLASRQLAHEVGEAQQGASRTGAEIDAAKARPGHAAAISAQPLGQWHADLRQVDRQVVAEISAPKLDGSRILAAPRDPSDEEIG